ncbi:GIY-YIG nuclease family protein [Tissierella sp. Yu-01]|uniref:GIY-YIG nuclease family protein n=1 Tax=Tissierella sp. Yu-01 TaxID=3035694 RepID=UPI00240DC177|nr:GIY-YIG nuclease family protein [Tissierella sp. Yu-01]WFA08880.1 GIY-YIG nuclease family protein [Tissierella sp. Yu-01]
MDRKKELKEQYKQMKPDMGIFIVRSNKTNKCYIETSQNLNGFINRTRFQLNSGGHPNERFQRDWKEQGENNFTIEILEKLEYDKDESKTDYSEELEVMKFVWKEKLAKENIGFY